MPKKRFSAEQIVTLLRQIEASMAQGNSTPISTACATDNEPVPDTARSGCTNAIISQARWCKISVRPAGGRAPPDHRDLIDDIDNCEPYFSSPHG
jgi:hypothetical protein